MNSTKQINSNFVDLLGIDLDEIRKKIENDILNGQSSVSRNGQSSGSGNEQTSGSGNGQTSVSGNTQSSDSKEYYSVSKQRVKHSEVLKTILSNIKEVDFRGEAGADKELDKLNFRILLVNCSKKILQAAEACGLGICNSHDKIYLYNGEYWNRVGNHKFFTFLGEAAYKMGIDEHIAMHCSFQEQLLKQLLFAADMYDENNFEDCNANNKTIINLANGTFEIDGLNIRLKNPEKEDFLTYQLPFKYDESAQCPIFDNYLNTVLPDINNQKVLLEYLGYLFLRNKSLNLEKSLILYGSGANGKSVLFDILSALLGGSQNVSNFSLQNLTNENGYYRAMLGNKLVNYASEINGKMDVSIFKQLVSGEPVDARLPYGEPFTLTNYGKLIFNCNQLPTSVEHTHAFFRRFLIIPFEVTIPEEQQDDQLAEKIIKSELAGVLNRVLEGLKRVLKQRRFTKSEAMEKILKDYKRESDNVSMFIEESGYEKTNEESILVMDLYNEYNAYCISGNYVAVSKKAFTSRIRNMGIIIEKKYYGMIVYLKKTSCR